MKCWCTELEEPTKRYIISKLGFHSVSFFSVAWMPNSVAASLSEIVWGWERVGSSFGDVLAVEIWVFRTWTWIPSTNVKSYVGSMCRSRGLWAVCLAELVSAGFQWEAPSQWKSREWLRKTLVDLVSTCAHVCAHHTHLCVYTLR